MGYFDDIGMIHDKEYDYYGNKHISENGPLFTAVYYYMKKELGLLTDTDKVNIVHIIRELWDGTRFSDRPLGTDIASHDNVTGILALSRLVGNYKPAEFSYLQFGKFHPRDIIYYGLAEGFAWAKLFIPLLYIIALVSCSANKSETSGKQLWWLRCKALGLDSLFGKCTKLVKQMNGNWANVFFIYYHKDVNHPIVRMAIELEKRNVTL